MKRYIKWPGAAIYMSIVRLLNKYSLNEIKLRKKTIFQASEELRLGVFKV